LIRHSRIANTLHLRRVGFLGMKMTQDTQSAYQVSVKYSDLSQPEKPQVESVCFLGLKDAIKFAKYECEFRMTISAEIRGVLIDDERVVAVGAIHSKYEG